MPPQVGTGDVPLRRRNGYFPKRGVASFSSENTRVAKDLLTRLAERGVDMNAARPWVIDRSKALRSAIDQVCRDTARVQRCRIHKIRYVAERLPKSKAAQARWVMTRALKGVPLPASRSSKPMPRISRHCIPMPLLACLRELFRINRLGVKGGRGVAWRPPTSSNPRTLWYGG